jgi:hypothetical protein
MFGSSGTVREPWQTPPVCVGKKLRAGRTQERSPLKIFQVKCKWLAVLGPLQSCPGREWWLV